MDFTDSTENVRDVMHCATMNAVLCKSGLETRPKGVKIYFAVKKIGELCYTIISMIEFSNIF